MNNLKGHFLSNCYNKNNLIYFLICLIIGFFVINNCIGPCLPHCYSKNNIIYFLIGFIIGIFVIKKLYFKKEKNDKQNI